MADITVVCEKCSKKFLILDQEQELLNKKDIPLPTLCPTHRQLRRLENRGERTLYKTTCQNCGNSVITSYDPKTATSKILCKKCYREYFEKNDVIQS